MAGGKGNRFDFNQINTQYQEKLLIPLGEKYIVEHVIDAALASTNISHVICAVAPASFNIKTIVGKNKSIELFETPGAGFHLDLKYIIKTLKLEATIIIAGDIPLITPEILDSIIEKFVTFEKPSLAVMADLKLFTKHNIIPSITFQSKAQKKELVPVGINIIDGRFIEQPEIEQAIFVSDSPELIYNINYLIKE